MEQSTGSPARLMRAVRRTCSPAGGGRARFEWAMGDSNLQRIPRGILGSVRTVVQKATQLGPPYRYLTRSPRPESGKGRSPGSQRHTKG